MILLFADEDERTLITRVVAAHCTANLTAGREQNEEPSARVPGLTRSIILEQLEATCKQTTHNVDLICSTQMPYYVLVIAVLLLSLVAAFWSEHAAIVQSKIEAISENYHPSPCT